MGANTAVVAKALGLSVGLVSVIGTDAGDYMKYLGGMGIELHLKGIFGDTTKSMFFKNNGDQISFFYKGVTEKLDELEPGETFKKELIKRASVVYLGRTYLNLQKKVVKSCRNKLVVYNPGYGVYDFKNIPQAFRDVLARTSVLVINQHELAHLNSLGFKVSSVSGPQAVIITKGVKGCSVYSKTMEVDIGVYKTGVVDASGAGDAFNAGFIAAQVKGRDIYESVKFGNATASFIVEAWGCQSNLPSWEKVVERVGRIE
jgi:sugar/nucleoside kinase (ribokinase family)